MKFQLIPHRNFLFLQGPPGPFFWHLSERLRALECGIFRINLNGGDQADWPGKATNYRGTRRKWTLFIDRFLSEHAITDLVLFGDCRPLHVAAHRMARLRKIDVQVFEEGYIRPDWLTLEPSGVNGYSSLPRDPKWYLEEARTLPPLPWRPKITASFNRRARDAFNYYSRVLLSRPLYPFYRSHRRGWLLAEALGWFLKLLAERSETSRAAQLIEKLDKQNYFLLPLQLSNDYQIREHSPFQDMAEAIDYVIYSFARRAPADAILIIKEHPLDASFTNWRGRIDTLARRCDVGNRVIHIDGGDLATLATRCRGMVTVNSTSATLALATGVPTIALGKAIYDMAGVTHQGRLDDFWHRPQAPDGAVYDAFRRVLYDRCLIYGGLASESAVSTLVHSAIERLIGDRVSHWASASLEEGMTQNVA
jgi:capsular polysaccharide export protein